MGDLAFFAYNHVTCKQNDAPLGAIWHHDPYNTFDNHQVIGYLPRPAPQRIVHSMAIPEGTLHAHRLAGQLAFEPYPTTEFFTVPARLPKAHMTRMFIGQLPYNVTDMQLNWLVDMFARSTVHFPERIMKRQDAKISRNHGVDSGTKLPTGCLHVYCDPTVVPILKDMMHKRILIDDTGVWYAQSEQEQQFLHAYCAELKADKKKRPFNRPYDTVVVTEAESNYRPPQLPPAYNF